MARGSCCPLLSVKKPGEKITETRIGGAIIEEQKEAGDEKTGVNSADCGS